MSDMNISTSLQGYQAAQNSLDARAARIAQATVQSASQAGSPKAAAPSTDITSDMVGMNTDRLAASYNLKAMKVQNSMLGEVLDILK
jgi:hypothetical protein